MWPAANCHCVNPGIRGTVRPTKENFLSELIPSSSGLSSSSWGGGGAVASSSQLIPSSSSATSSSTHNPFIQVNSRGFACVCASHLQVGFPGYFAGDRMKQRLEGKLHNASSSSNWSNVGSAAWGKPKVAVSSVKMQVAVNKELSSVEDGKEGAADPAAAAATVKVEIEKLSNNSRKIDAKIAIAAPLDVIWGILTDYEHLADFFPGLAESKCLEKKGNKCRLYQVGEQNLALGFKFKAKAVLDCEEKPSKMIDNNIMRRDIDFETVEGDFQVFRGTWRMEQQISTTSPGDSLGKEDKRAGEGEGGTGGGGEDGVSTLLTYILVVQPKAWLPVGLVEGRLTSEVKTNLTCIRDRSLFLQLPGS